MPADIQSGLVELAKENYIEWNQHTPPETACIIEGWERDNPAHIDPDDKQKQTSAPNNTDYWLMY